MVDFNSSKPIIKWVNIAKGIGILLVVIGHFLPASSPDYWVKSRGIIYGFHMPFFFLISGYLYTFKQGLYFNLLKSKFKRLVVPFVSVALIYFIIKLLASQFVALKYPVGWDSILQLINNPLKSYVPLLWFVHALILMFFVYPLLRNYMNAWVALFFTIILSSTSQVLGLELPVVENMVRFLPFFVIGNLFKENNIIQQATKRRKLSWLFTALFCFMLMIPFSFHLMHIEPKTFSTVSLELFIGAMGSLLIINIACLINNTIYADIFSRLGLASMSIYLFHTIFESGARLMLNHLCEGCLPFLVVAIISISVGVLFPIFLEKFVIKKSKRLSSILLGS